MSFTTGIWRSNNRESNEEEVGEIETAEERKKGIDRAGGR